MKDYSHALDYELELMCEVQSKLPSAQEWAARIERAWPMLQRPENEWRLKRIMEILSNAKARRERLQRRFGL